MKKLLMLLFVTIASIGIATAQDSSTVKNKTHHMAGDKMAKDCVKMEDGKMMVMKDGTITPMDKEMTMANGTTVSTDGTVKLKDGTTKQLKNGDCVYMSGKMMSGMKKDPMDKKPMR